MKGWRKRASIARAAVLCLALALITSAQAFSTLPGVISDAASNGIHVYSRIGIPIQGLEVGSSSNGLFGRGFVVSNNQGEGVGASSSGILVRAKVKTINALKPISAASSNGISVRGSIQVISNSEPGTGASANGILVRGTLLTMDKKMPKSGALSNGIYAVGSIANTATLSPRTASSSNGINVVGRFNLGINDPPIVSASSNGINTRAKTYLRDALMPITGAGSNGLSVIADIGTHGGSSTTNGIKVLGVVRKTADPAEFDGDTGAASNGLFVLGTLDKGNIQQSGASSNGIHVQGLINTDSTGEEGTVIGIEVSSGATSNGISVNGTLSTGSMINPLTGASSNGLFVQGIIRAVDELYPATAASSNGIAASGTMIDLSNSDDSGASTNGIVISGTLVTDQPSLCEEFGLHVLFGEVSCFCGDGRLDDDEQCDDGNDNNNDACTNTCQLATCGDGYLQGSEQCDFGSNNNDAGACTTSCEWGPQCSVNEFYKLIPEHTLATDIEMRECGYILAAENSIDPMFSEFDHKGEFIQSKIIETAGNSNWYHPLQKSIKTSDGGYLVLGISHYYQIFIAKLDQNYVLQWEQSIDTSDDQITLVDVIEDHEGNFVASGTNNNYNDFLLYKFSSDGSLIWRKTLSALGGGDGIGYSIEQDEDHNYVVVGVKQHDIAIDAHGIYVGKFDMNGNQIISKYLYDDPLKRYVARDFIINEDSSITIAGYVRENSISNPTDSLLITKFDTNYDPVWSRTIETQQGFKNFFATSITHAHQGGYVVVGGLSGADDVLPYHHFDSLQNGQKLITAVFDESGNLQHSYTTLNEFTVANDIEQHPMGGYAIAGQAQTGALLVRTNNLGNVTFCNDWVDLSLSSNSITLSSINPIASQDDTLSLIITVDGTPITDHSITSDTFICYIEPNICGNGFHEPTNGEQCDDGNNIDDDSCSNTCVAQCVLSSAQWIYADNSMVTSPVQGWEAGRDNTLSQTVYMEAIGNHCAGEDINYTIYEDDVFFDDFVDSLLAVYNTYPVWQPPWYNDALFPLIFTENPQYYFVAEDPLGNQLQSQTLEITRPPELVGSLCGNGILDFGEECDEAGLNTDTACTPDIGEQCHYCNTTCYNITLGTIECHLFDVEISLNPANDNNFNGLADEGDIITINATINPNCQDADRILVEASSIDNSCTIIPGASAIIDAMNETITITQGDSSAITEWTVPSIPAECQGKTVNAQSAALYSDTSQAPVGSTLSTPSGSFTFAGAVCGNGLPNSGEQCDDANSNNSDSCIIDPLNGYECKDAFCGDNYTRSGFEQCDDGNAIDTDSCTSSCQIAFCGDSIIQSGVEECDDGNIQSGDRCSSTCQYEASFIWNEKNEQREAVLILGLEKDISGDWQDYLIVFNSSSDISSLITFEDKTTIADDAPVDLSQFESYESSYHLLSYYWNHTGWTPQPGDEGTYRAFLELRDNINEVIEIQGSDRIYSNSFTVS